jgi:hypothetical protein
MLKRAARFATVLALAVFISVGTSAATDDIQNKAALTVHEWGTFTSIAGEDGRAVEWLPFGGPTGRSDLPCFVERFDEFPEWTLSATVRMETPVLYFYSPHGATVDARVRFPQGIMTEWYPRATVRETMPNEDSFRGYFEGVSGLQWRGVKVLPGTSPVLPVEPGASHYYAARETDAAPIRVDGQDEKFLFYRGVGTFPVPIAAKVEKTGRITIRKLGKNDISSVILFENRGGKMGYRAGGVLKKEITLDPPELRNDFAALQRKLESVLVENGLYPGEAQAMLATWRDLWFEEGTRVFYIVPPHDVDKILPLKIDPKPVQSVRVFVGRMELITAATEEAVAAAIRANDRTALAAYARFLVPVTKRLLARSATADDKARLKEFQTRSVNPAAYLNGGSRCKEAESGGTDAEVLPR